MNPIFKWAGSKRYLASILLPKFPSRFDRYIEPFCGSASLYFLLEPQAALLGDLNGELINALASVKERPVVLAEALHSLPTSEEDYYLIRSLPLDQLDALERAARFLYLNKYCFNGLYRTNRNGQFNVPFGRKHKLAADEDVRYLSAATLLRTADLIVADFEEICNRAVAGDFVYLDPPYATTSSSIFTEYGKRSFGVADIERLDHTLNCLDSRGIQFMLSYSDGPEIRNIARKWHTEKVEVRRNIAGFVGHRRKAQEVVVKNY